MTTTCPIIEVSLFFQGWLSKPLQPGAPRLQNRQGNEYVNILHEWKSMMTSYKRHTRGAWQATRPDTQRKKDGCNFLPLTYPEFVIVKSASLEVTATTISLYSSAWWWIPMNWVSVSITTKEKIQITDLD